MHKSNRANTYSVKIYNCVTYIPDKVLNRITIYQSSGVCKALILAHKKHLLLTTYNEYKWRRHHSFFPLEVTSDAWDGPSVFLGNMSKSADHG